MSIAKLEFKPAVTDSEAKPVTDDKGHSALSAIDKSEDSDSESSESDAEDNTPLQQRVKRLIVPLNNNKNKASPKRGAGPNKKVQKKIEKMKKITKKRAKPRAHGSDGGGFFVVHKTRPDGRNTLKVVTLKMLRERKKTGKYECVHHVGGSQHATLTDARRKSIHKAHQGKVVDFKCSRHVCGWQKKAMKWCAYFG